MVRPDHPSPVVLILLALGLLWLAGPGYGQALQANIQRDRMILSETLGLTVSSDIGLDLNRLDLSPLESDFQVLGRSSGTQISMVNGVTTRTSTLELQLRPLREGLLQIPALSLDGHSSAPLQIEVSAAPVSGDQLDPSQDYIIQIEVDDEAPYVQQQVLVTVRLYYGVVLSDGSLSEPSADGAMVTRLGRDEIYSRQIGGRNYQVLQRNYAVVPQESGELSLGPLLLTGRAGRGGGMFGRGQPISLSSRSVELQVRRRPADFPGPDWLPARGVELEESLSQGPYRVGEPITRTLQLRALGVSESILPEIPASAPDAGQIYPDQPVRALGQDSGRLVATLEQKLAIVPGRAGTLALPAIRLPWWDVEQDRLAWAQLPSRDVEVLPAQNAGAASSTIADGSLDGPPLQGQLVTPAAANPGAIAQGSLWPWLSLLFATLWLATLALWWLGPRQPRTGRPSVELPNERAARHALEAACRRADPAAAERAALQLYRARGGEAVGSARALAQRIDQPTLHAALVALDQARYAAQSERWNSQLLMAEIDALRPQAARLVRSQSAQELPPLYPRP